MASELATLAGGCFWCLEAVYLDVEGVESVVSGYMGGHVDHPSYEEVCGMDTGHAEVVQLTFDPGRIRYAELLEIFFAIHDPTTLNRQGHDIGAQYRSAIFTHSEEQAAAAMDVISGLDLADPVVTEVMPARAFWPAEEHHQNYFARHPNQPYCQFAVSPKVSKFRQKFAARRKKS
jgi:peptide-methionine (S)-S-oxide reductase